MVTVATVRAAITLGVRVPKRVRVEALTCQECFEFD